MRILWWSNAPWCGTGYGVQTALFAPLIRDLGHDVAIGAFHGLLGRPTEWNGIPVYPGGRDNWGMDVIAGHARHWRADLVITLMDTWVISPAAVRDLPLACWTPVDCVPLGAPDEGVLRDCGARVIAMSRHGERMLGEAGLEAFYIPHGVDAQVFAPPAGRGKLRESMGLDGMFAVGINAANTDKSRKGFPEQFRAFAEFSRQRKNSVLLVHTAADNSSYGGLNLHVLAQACGISDRVRFCSQHDYFAGLAGAGTLAGWYGALDLLSNCSYGEGFGLPVLEAQACGTPAVVTGASSMPELRGPGWQVRGEPHWNFLHQSWWAKPRITEITRAYEQAYLDAPARRKAARDFALKYDIKNVLEYHWRPALEHIASTSRSPT